MCERSNKDCLWEWVAYLPKQITLGQNQVARTYNFVSHLYGNHVCLLRGKKYSK